jgi:hypothetical protein
MWALNNGTLFAWWVSSGSDIVNTVLSRINQMDHIHVQNCKTRTYYGYMMEQMLISTDPLKNLLNEEAFQQTPEHIQQIYKLYFTPIVVNHKRVAKAFRDYGEKLCAGVFYDGPLRIDEAKMQEFQIFLDCATDIVHSSKKFLLDYAKLKPDIFKLCDMSLLND